MLRLTYPNNATEPKVFDYDDDVLLLPEARLMKSKVGMNPVEFWEAYNAGDADAYYLLWVLACLRNGEPIEDVEGYARTFDIAQLRVRNVTPDVADLGPQDPDLPTGLDVTSSEPSTTSTPTT